MTPYDLVLRNARVFDPARGVDSVQDIAFDAGKVAATGQRLQGRQTEDATGLLVTPGLIDLHTHVYWGGTSLSVDPMELARRGCTTLVDTGSAGPGNFAGFRKHVIEPCPVRIITYLNISFAGIYAFSKTVMVGESGDHRLIAPAETVEVIKANRDLIAGIKVRVGRNASADAGLAPLDAGRQAADYLGVPMMVHIDLPPPTICQVLERMRPGDILTHCFRPFPNCPVTGDGKVLPSVLDARQRGVIFDIGHGMGSFSFDVARQMLANGFPPDTISSDVHALCIDGPAFDLTTTMSKFLCLGMSLDEVVKRSTTLPAQALGRPDLGTFAPGATGDASLLEIQTGAFDYQDSTGAILRGNQSFKPRGIVVGGQLLAP